MTEKAKERGALAGIIFVSLAGLGCMATGIWAIVDMPKPYLNQWVNFADKKFKFDPIMGKCNPKSIESWAEKEGITGDWQDVVPQYYLSRLVLTPEIFVDDFLSHINDEVQFLKDETTFTNDTLRLSSPKVTQVKKDSETKYLIEFRWDQQLEYTTSSNKKILADWSIWFEDVPVSLVFASNQWGFHLDLSDTNWKGGINIKKTEGIGSQQPTTGEQPINSTNFTNYDEWFTSFDFISDYLEDCIPNKK